MLAWRAVTAVGALAGDYDAAILEKFEDENEISTDGVGGSDGSGPARVPTRSINLSPGDSGDVEASLPLLGSERSGGIDGDADDVDSDDGSDDDDDDDDGIKASGPPLRLILSVLSRDKWIFITGGLSALVGGFLQVRGGEEGEGRREVGWHMHPWLLGRVRTYWVNMCCRHVRRWLTTCSPAIVLASKYRILSTVASSMPPPAMMLLRFADWSCVCGLSCVYAGSTCPPPFLLFTRA